MRLITVVMGEPDSTTRSSETVSMLDYGFNTYEVNTLVSKNDIVDNVRVNFSVDEVVKIVPVDDINILNNKIGEKRNITYKVITNKVEAPLKKGDIVGKIDVYDNNKVIMSIDTTVYKDIKKVNIFIAYVRELKNIINGYI